MGTCGSRHCLDSIEADEDIGSSFKTLSSKMHSEGVDVRIDVPVDSGGDSRFRFVEQVEGECHTHFQPILSRGLADHSH